MTACEHCGEEHARSERFCPNTGKPLVSRLFGPGTVLEGKYRIERTIGIGGMGAVYEAQHLLLDKRVAVKIILPGAASTEDLAQRLVREARAAAATGHRNIAAVTDLGHASDGSLFVVMEFLDGKTLRAIVDEQGALAPGRAVALTDQVLAGLEAVHAKGIIHRDLKPENLMLVVDDLGEELVKIFDFGISKFDRPGQSQMTKEGLVVGTPSFMAPEQIRAQRVDHRADLYACGVILYYLLTNTTPFAGESITAILTAALTTDPEPPSRRRPEVSAELDRVVLTAMSREPDDRYPNARAFRTALQTCVEPVPAAWEGGSLLTGGPAPAPKPAGPAPQLDPGSFDESSLVGLDEMPPPRPQAKAAPEARTVAAKPPDPAPAPPPKIDPAAFRPPQAAEELLLEAEVPASRPRPEPVAPEPQLGPSAHESHPPDRVAGFQGQARRRPPVRIELWVVLAAAIIGGSLYWLLSRPSSPPPPTELPRVRLTFRVNPHSAKLWVDGVLLTDHWLLLAKSQRDYRVQAFADGYHSWEMNVRADSDQELDVVLRPKAIPDEERPAKKPRKRRPR
jgi:eukaryotic-like serine/threonine-protein kinase